jgi:hypothetical protein
MKFTQSQIATIVAELRADPRFSADWQKEIGARVGRPSADGTYSFEFGVTGLHAWAVTPGFFHEPRWYESVFAKHAA